MKTLIIEDEKPAAQQLMRLLERSTEFNGSIEGPIESIEAAVEHLGNHGDYDLIFMDIHLVDGPSFEIFKSIEPPAPIIFCTAYDQYALEAFKLNSIDYLLKPIEPEELDRALVKFSRLYQNSESRLSADAILEMLSGSKETPQYKQRFIIKIGDRILSLASAELAYFYSADKATFGSTVDGKDYPLEYSLDQLEGMLNPEDYFRVNRKYLISHKSIADMRSYSGSRIKLELKHNDDSDLLVSRDKTADFKLWLDR
jgi:DNA-binding LytR/AlgR family response regulator